MNRVKKGVVWKPHPATTTMPTKGRYTVPDGKDNKKFLKIVRSMSELRDLFGSRLKEKWVCDEKVTTVVWKIEKGFPMTRAEATHSLAASLVYMTDCTLATVSRLAMLKKKTKSEFARQISIAQFGVDRIVQYNIKYENSRTEDVVKKFSGSVEEWAIDIESKYQFDSVEEASKTK